MEYEEIIEAIGREAADLPPDVAERAAQAVLQTLAERLPRGEARHILIELPAELKPWVYTETDAEGFGIDEFLERVARREGTDIETALRHARAVFAALGRALDADAVAHLAASLPQTFEPLVAEAQQRFLGDYAGGRVLAAGRAAARPGPGGGPPGHRGGAGDAGGEDRRGRGRGPGRPARPAAAPAVAARHCLVGPGRAADAAGGVPAPGGRAGKRGRGRGRAGGRVFKHVRAVFATLAEAVDAEEWFDMIAELPAEYSGLIPERSA